MIDYHIRENTDNKINHDQPDNYKDNVLSGNQERLPQALYTTQERWC